jgi:hypothetical protein
MDTRDRARSTDEYEVLLAGGLLRKLLLDAHPFVDRVNAKHRVKVRFRINGPTEYEEIVLSDGPRVVLRGLAPLRAAVVESSSGASSG